MVKKRLLISVSLLFILAACSKGKEETQNESTDEQKILAYAEPIVDNLLLGLNEGNYQKFSRDFDGQMKSTLNSNVFMQTRQRIVERIGNYVSKRFLKFEEKGEFIGVIYTAEFEKEKGVTVRVVFRKGDERHQVTGLWFNSPRLRG